MSSITREQVLAIKTFAEVAKLLKESPDEMRPIMKGEVLVHIQSLINARNVQLAGQETEVDRQLALNNPPSTEELAEQAAAVAAESAAVVPPVVEATPPATVDHTEEDASWKTEGVTVQRDAQGKIVRMVQEYQVRDDDDSPIGRPTHLEARTPYELLSKQRVAHENATRAFHRLKKQKLTFKQTEENRLLTPAEISAAATKALEGKDAAEAEKIVRSVLENDFKQKETALLNEREYAEGQKIGNTFIRRHLHDFNANEANLKALGEYLREHNMEFTLDNLEAAFIDLRDQGNKLAAVNAAVTRPAESANTPATATPAAAPTSELPATAPAAAVTPPVVAQPAAAVSQPVVEATVSTPVAPNPAPATRRPGVNGSITPGTMSAHRPGAVDPALARKEFMKELKAMTSDQIRKKLNDSQFVKQLETYGVKVR
jgi:hypothetical protein